MNISLSKKFKEAAAMTALCLGGALNTYAIVDTVYQMKGCQSGTVSCDTRGYETGSYAGIAGLGLLWGGIALRSKKGQQV